MRCLAKRPLCCLLYLALACECFGEDWPQFLGPQRNGISTESTALVESFPNGTPKVVWRVAGGVGMSGIAVANGKCYTTANRDNHQVLIALDSLSGKQSWAVPLAAAYENQMGDGPRATPTINASYIFSFTGEGILTCNAQADGKQVWQRDLPKDLKTKPSDYGMSCSPLIVNNLVIVQVGASQATVIAVDATTGKTVWSAGNGRAGYSSPALLNIAGRSQIVAFAGSECLGLDPSTGNVLWQFPYVTDYECNAATPVAIGDQVFISSGENHGSVLLQITPKGAAFEVTKAWESQGTGSALRSEWQTPLVTGDLLFGFDNVGSAGPVTNLTCLDSQTGKVLWKQMRFGKSNGILADGKLLISTMDGELVLVRAQRSGFAELARAKVLGKTRQAPALSNGFAFLRDDEEIVCLDLRRPKN